MDTQQRVEPLVTALMLQSGRYDALAAAIIGILQAAGSNSALAKAVESSLELHYSGLLADMKNEHYLQGFESVHEYIREVLQQHS